MTLDFSRSDRRRALARQRAYVRERAHIFVGKSKRRPPSPRRLSTAEVRARLVGR
jgi:hypothetical protein